MTDQAGRPTPKAVWRLDDHKRFFESLRQQTLEGARDRRTVLFSGIVFPIGFKPIIVFGARESIPNIDFEGCIFAGKAKFRQANFDGVPVFRGEVFEETVDFEFSVFRDQSNFERTIFKKRANFKSASFVDMTKFNKSVFEHQPSFESASFGSWTFFTEAQFHGMNPASFDFAAFNNGIFFDSAEFHRGVWFKIRTEQNRQWKLQRGIEPQGDVNDGQDRNFPQIHFKGAIFKGRADFSNRHFLETTDFSDVDFEIAPEFHNCVLHQDTDFSGTHFRDTKSKHAARAYRTLKIAMGDVHARNEEAMFYAKEQDSLRRRKDIPWSIKIMSWTYMALSDYGRSYIRPLSLLALMTVCFSLVYWFWDLRFGGSGDPSGAFGFTMKQILRPFFIWTSRDIPPSELAALAIHWPLTLRLVATAQSIASIGMIALFLLALRRQFRLH